MTLNIHNTIKNKLNIYVKNNTIPNIIFHGPNGSGKKTLLEELLILIYGNDQNIKHNCLFVDCARGIGIKFIREELKNFAKTQINYGDFKSIILLNGEKLTIDAQSSLRRCIEIFNHNTRFFIVIEDKFKLLKPIISRFSEIYVPLPIINNQPFNLYNLKKNEELNKITDKKHKDLEKKLISINKKSVNKKKEELFNYVEEIYNKGWSGLDILEYISNNLELLNIDENDVNYLTFLINIEKFKKEIKNEKIIILIILQFYLFRYNIDLENIYIF